MSRVATQQVRFDERLGPLILGVAVLGAGTAWVAWQMFATGGDPDVVRYGGRKVLPRGAVEPVEPRRSGAVSSHLRHDVDEATRRRAGVEDPQQTWVPLAGQYWDAEQLPPVVEAGFEVR